MARTEYQAKTRHTIAEETLLALGAEPISQFATEDTYIWKSPAGVTCRIRNENGKYTLAHKGADYGEHVRVKSIEGERVIDEKEAKTLVEQHGIVEQIMLSGQIYKLNGAIISFEHVDFLGDFVEVSGVTEDEVLATFTRLGVNRDELIKESYFDLMSQKKRPRWLKAILHMRAKVSQVTFGIISGIMTTVGVLVGVNATIANKLAVAGAVIAVAISDSWSDAFGMYNSKRSENCTLGVALRYAAGTMFGKVLMPVIFLVPILYTSLPTAIRIDIAIGALVLTLLSVVQAIISQKNWAKRIATNLALAALIMLLSQTAGNLVHQHFGG